MNVAARLCEYCKAVNQRLVISGNLLHKVTVPVDLRVGGGDMDGGAESAGLFIFGSVNCLTSLGYFLNYFTESGYSAVPIPQI